MFVSFVSCCWVVFIWTHYHLFLNGQKHKPNLLSSKQKTFQFRVELTSSSGLCSSNGHNLSSLSSWPHLNKTGETHAIAHSYLSLLTSFVVDKDCVILYLLKQACCSLWKREPVINNCYTCWCLKSTAYMIFQNWTYLFHKVRIYS